MLSEISIEPDNQAEEMRDDLSDFFAKLAQNKKSVTVSVLSAFVLSLVLGGLSVWSNKVLFFVQMAGFFALGYAHAKSLLENSFSFGPTQKIFYSFLLTLVVLLALCLLTIFKGSHSWLMVAACACAFAWPFSVIEAEKLFGQKSLTQAPVWRYDPALPFQKTTTFLNSIPVRFRVEIESSSEKSQTVFFRAPVRMPLGTIFYHTVQENEKGNAINLLDPNGQPYEWTFSSSFLGFSRYLKPELGLIENNVKPNALIVVRRLSNEPI